MMHMCKEDNFRGWMKFEMKRILTDVTTKLGPRLGVKEGEIITKMLKKRLIDNEYNMKWLDRTADPQYRVCDSKGTIKCCYCTDLWINPYDNKEQLNDLQFVCKFQRKVLIDQFVHDARIIVDNYGKGKPPSSWLHKIDFDKLYKWLFTRLNVTLRNKNCTGRCHPVGS